MKNRDLSRFAIGRNAISLFLIAGIVLIIIGIVMQLFAVYPTDETGRIIWRGTDPSAILGRLLLSTALILSGIAIVGFFLFHNPHLAEESAAALMKYDRERTEKRATYEEKRPFIQPTRKCKICGVMNEEGATYCTGCANPLISRDQIQREKSEKEEMDYRKEGVRRGISYVTGWLLCIEAITVIMVTIANIADRTTNYTFIGEFIACFVFICLIFWAFLTRPTYRKTGLALLVWTVITTFLLSFTHFWQFYLSNW